jgi:hypothetical protein
MEAIDRGATLSALVEARGSDGATPYDPVYAGESQWTLLPAFDHPEDPGRCLVTGTGLTHRKSADSRQSMHDGGGGEARLTDSMKMYRLGLAGGAPAPGAIGSQPEWFYKGNGRCVRPHNAPLDVPAFALDGGEEAEIVAAYVIAPDGAPWRVGMAVGNEFADHVLEQQNYLYLSASKLRVCAVGPELVAGEPFDDIRGEARIERGGKVIWRAPQATGEVHMNHSLANLEHHHFKYAAHRHPGDAHLHFLGADAFSYGDRVKLRDGDVMVLDYPKLGRALRNPVAVDAAPQSFVALRSL